MILTLKSAYYRAVLQSSTVRQWLHSSLLRVFVLLLLCVVGAHNYAFAQSKIPSKIEKPADKPSTPQNVLQSTTSTLATSATPSTSASLLKSLMQEKRASTTANIRLYEPMREFERMMLTATQAFVSIEKKSIQWLDYKGLPDIVSERLPGVFPLFLGLQGAFNHLSILGSTPRDVAFLIDGRPVGNQALGAAYLEQYSPEMAEEIEVFLGSDAAILANNASGAVLNIQELRHDTKNLHVRMWYQQFGDQFTAADVDVSNNIAPNLNLTLGARTQNANRIYNHTGSRLWNARAVLRWNPSSTASLALSYHLTDQRVTLNGGLISSTLGTFDVVSSSPIFNELQERTLRHDLTLTGSAFLTRDSSLAATLTAYASVDGRALEKSSLQGGNVASSQTFFSPDVSIEQATSTNISIGATGRIETRVLLFSALEASLLAGGTAALHSIPETVYWSAAARAGANPVRTQSEISAFGRLNLTLANSLKLSGGARLAVIGSRPEIALGAKASLMLLRSTTTNIEFWADASRSFRVPTLAEEGSASASEALKPPPLRTLAAESHLLGLAGFRFSERSAGSVFLSDVLAFGRFITNPILYETVAIPRFWRGEFLASTRAYNADSRTVLGASLTANWHRKNLFGSVAGVVLSGFANGTLSQTDGLADRRFPLLNTGISAQIEFTFGRDVLRAGVRARAMTAFAGERFSPMLWAYIPATEEQGLTGNGIDVIAGAEIFGSLFLRATYQNALNVAAYTVAGYPQFPSVLRFTVSATILGN